MTLFNSAFWARHLALPNEDCYRHVDGNLRKYEFGFQIGNIYDMILDFIVCPFLR